MKAPTYISIDCGTPLGAIRVLRCDPCRDGMLARSKVFFDALKTSGIEHPLTPADFADEVNRAQGEQHAL